MNKGLLAVLVAAGCAASVGPVVADTVEGVTVEAARVVEVGRTAYGAAEQQVVLRRGVSYKGLDLKTAEGRAGLEVRVKETATTLCKELDKMYPLQDKKQAECVADAVRSGMAEATKLAK